MRRAARVFSVLSPLLVVLALSKVHAAFVADPPYDYTGSARFAWSLGYAAVLLVSTYGVGLPDLPRGWRAQMLAAIGASTAAAVAVSVVQLMVGDALLPRFVVFGTAAALVPTQWVTAVFSQAGRGRDASRDGVVLVGSGREMERLIGDLDQAPERPAVVVARLEVADLKRTDGGSKPLVRAFTEVQASVLVLDRAALAEHEVLLQASLLHEAGIRVRSLVEFYEDWLGKLPLSELEPASLFFDIGEVHRLRYARVKRLVDIFSASVGLAVLVLATPAVLVGNLIANRGPLLYRQARVGRGGAPFEIYKFRTMVPASNDQVDSSWTAEADPRITRFGGVLRRTHMDELPQLVNILKGDLSLVGPRPEQPHYVAELSAKLPFYGMRHLVRPGLTGWAQVKYGYAGDEDDALEKLQYEFFYLRHQDLRFDARVIGRTIRSVLGGQGSGR